MDWIALLLLAVGLSTDAFAVSVCKGLAMPRATPQAAALVGAWFGGFQFLMPVLGFLLGSRLERFVAAVAPWISFGLLAAIGANMAREALLGDEGESCEPGLDAKTMAVMAVATSIDALAVGISFALVPAALFAAAPWVNALTAALVIGLVTFCLSCLGVEAGNLFGARFRSRAQLAGGLVLIAIGLRILLAG